MICQRCLVLIVFLWWLWKSGSLNFHAYWLNSSICIWRNFVVQTAEKYYLWYLHRSCILVYLSRSTGAVAFDISKTFHRVWHDGLLHKLKHYETSGRVFGLILSFLTNRWFLVVVDGKPSQIIQLMLIFLKDPFLNLHFPYCTMTTFLMVLSVIL